jgi:cellobiose phosphorylase
VSIYNFDDKNNAINVYKYDLPQPWINYLSNGRLHAFVSQAGGGFLWWKNPTDYRITRYRTYNLPIDSPGFYIYIRHMDGTVWSPTFRP